jgi:hypothetical protein
MNLLVFPINSEFLLNILPVISQNSDKVIGATSNISDKIEFNFDQVELLPSINESGFDEKFQSLINKYSITNIVSFHPLVRLYLENNLKRINPAVVLHPITIQKILEVKLNSWKNIVKVFQSLPQDFNVPVNKSTELLTAIKKAQEVYGETSGSKILEIMQLFPELPPGDIVEIGVFFGKSAFILSEFSRIFHKGNLLFIDPWEIKNSIQEDNADLLKKLSADWNWEFIFESFLMNLSTISRNYNFNFMRMNSSEAIEIYRKGGPVVTAEFGETNFTGKISLLHVDGNHNYQQVKDDISNWLPLVVNKGWVIFDDYTWSMGNGVKIAVDEYCANNGSRIAQTRHSGRTFFLQVLND